MQNTSLSSYIISDIRQALKDQSSTEVADTIKRFFKTSKGEYSQHDIFIGVKVPNIRKLAKEFGALPLAQCKELLKSPIHEERLLALLILVKQYKKAKEEIFTLYLEHTEHINNWDLVDLSAYFIVGPYLQDKDREILLKLAKSKNIWERRIAIVSTMHFIRNNEFDFTLRLVKLLIDDKESLIHKAMGWMLREIGKRNSSVLEMFLEATSTKLPRTTLRYAIEKFPEEKRLSYLKKVKDAK